MIVHGFETQVTSGDHADPHHLRLDLAEAGHQAAPPAPLRDQDAGGTHERVDDVADLQRELLDPPGHAGTDHRLVQIDLGLRQRRLGAGLLGRQQTSKAWPRRLA